MGKPKFSNRERQRSTAWTWLAGDISPDERYQIQEGMQDGKKRFALCRRSGEGVEIRWQLTSSMWHKTKTECRREATRIEEPTLRLV